MDNQYINNECISETIYVDDILTIDIENLSSHRIINYECLISLYIQTLMEELMQIKTKNINNNIKIENFTPELINYVIEYLSWISISCELLAKRIGQDIYVHEKIKNPSIIRSSYNFCPNYTHCNKFYCSDSLQQSNTNLSCNKNISCKDHHYVHNLLKLDVDSLIYYLRHLISIKRKPKYEEFANIYSSIKTICYVTRHMVKEINYIEYFSRGKSEYYHKNNIYITKIKPYVSKIKETKIIHTPTNAITQSYNKFSVLATNI